MKENLFNSKFAKNSKFDNDFVGNIDNYQEWLILSRQFEKYTEEINQNKDIKAKIPKKIHQIWLGKKKLPAKYKIWINSWKRFNKEWEYKLWDEENIKELKVQDFDIYSRDINPGYRSDIIRYIILKKFGGVYIDTDFECLRKIPNNLLHYNFVSCTIFGNKPSIANGMMMSSPNHILINNILNSINTEQYVNDIQEILKNSGPDKLTNEYFLLAKFIEKDTLILPSNYFYPFTNFMLNKNINKYKEVEEVSIGIHHWEMSWIKGSIFNRIKNKFKKYFF